MTAYVALSVLTLGVVKRPAGEGLPSGDSVRGALRTEAVAKHGELRALRRRQRRIVRQQAIHALRGLEAGRGIEFDFTFQVEIDFRTMREAERQRVGRHPLGADQPADAGVVARYRGKAVRALRQCARDAGAGHDRAEVHGV